MKIKPSKRVLYLLLALGIGISVWVYFHPPAPHVDSPKVWDRLLIDMSRTQVLDYMNDQSANAFEYTNMVELKGYDLWVTKDGWQMTVHYSNDFAPKVNRIVKKYSFPEDPARERTIVLVKEKDA